MIGRREFLALGGAALARAQQKESAVVAGATVDTAPRVGIVLSSFKGGEQHDGTPLKGLDHPRPVDAALTDDELDALVRKAIEMAALRNGDFASAVEPDAWVAILPGRGTDPRIVKSVVSFLVERKRGMRFTVLGASDGLRFPGVRFEVADLSSVERVELPVPGKALARNNPSETYRIPKIVQQCDRLISIAPLQGGIALTIANYLELAPVQPADEVMIDLFSYHPADFAIAGGCEGFNLMVAGAKAPCVDAVAATLMGFKPADLPFLAMAERKGFGTRDVDAIWTRGNEIEEALLPSAKKR